MQFLNPTMLWALFALMLPIIIHLFYFRRYKKVPFTNVDFLAELKEEKSIRDRLRRILILLSRLLALLFIILAFARPFIPGEERSTSRQNVVSIYLDNSFSMDANGQETSLLEEGKRIATEIIESFPSETEIQIIPNSTSAIYQRLHSPSDVGDILDEIETDPNFYTLNEIQNLQYQSLKDYDNFDKSLFYISDFQTSISNLSSVSDSTYQVSLIPLKSEQDHNLSIDSIWLESPTMQANQANQLYVKITNHGEQDISDVRLSISYENETRPAGVLMVHAGESRIDTLNIFPKSEGWSSAKIEISDFPIQYDNTYYIAYDVPKKLKVLAITTQENIQITSKLGAMRFIDLDATSVQEINYSDFSTYDLIMLNDLNTLSSGLIQELEAYTRSGGKLLIFPSTNADISNYNILLNKLSVWQLAKLNNSPQDVHLLNQKSFVFKNVYQQTNERLTLPTVQSYYSFNKNYKQVSENLMSFRNGSPYLQQFIVDNGYVYMSSSPLAISENSLVQRGDIFAPMIYRMALQRAANSQLSYTIGQDNLISINLPSQTVTDEPIKFVNENNEFIPAQRRDGNRTLLDIGQSKPLAGIYDIKMGSELLSKVALNYDRRESQLQKDDVSSLKEKYPSMSVVDYNEQRQLNDYLRASTLGTEMWWYFIVIALIFLAIEQLLIRFLKYE